VKTEPPGRQLAAFLARYSPDIRKKARAAIVKVRARLPGAVELVYDNYNALVIGFGPNERPSEAILSIALYPRSINLFFLHGALLSDPHKLLLGDGKQVRRIALDDPKVLDTAHVRALIAEAVTNADTPFSRTKPRRLIIKSIAPKQRPRRPL
jgi:hypothetical protein